MNLLVFGYGFIGSAFADAASAAGHTLQATFRTPARREQLEAKGISAVALDNDVALAQALKAADGLVITPAPSEEGCPAFAVLSSYDLSGKWIAYLSTTGVYGDRGGDWVTEASTLLPTSTEGRRRVLAETQWLGQQAHIFRLPGLYGPGRNVIERLMRGDARRIHKTGHVFSRLHHDDCATALIASLNAPHPGRVYNLCDDEPAPADTVLEWAGTLTGLPLPPVTAWDDPVLPASMLRFYRDNKKVANDRAKTELNWQPLYPTYREGLTAIWQTIQAAKFG